MRLISIAKWVFAMGAVLLLADCAQNPVTGRQNFVLMSESEELRTGHKADPEIREEYGVYESSALQNYVSDIGRRLARNSHRPGLDYRFTVLDSPEINAFALPGGYIYITRGLLAYLNSEAELAAVLGHEIGHVTARHSVQQYTASAAANVGMTVASILVPELGTTSQSIMGVIGNALLSGYGREHELEADRLGAQYLARTGYDPQAMINVIGVLKNQEIFDANVAKQEGRPPRRYHGVFATHPDNDTRLQQVVGEARQIPRTGSVVGRDEFLRKTDGMIFGDNPDQGAIRGNVFLHSVLGFGLSFPPGWRLTNRPEKVQAISPGGDGAIELLLGGNAEGSPEDYLRRQFKPGTGTEIRTLNLNGLRAATATLSRSPSPLLVTVVYLENKAYIALGRASNADTFNRYLSSMKTAIGSFHPITDSERKMARAYTIKTIIPKRGATYAELARLCPLGKNAEGYLRLLNAQYPSGEPIAGQVLKIVQ